MEDSASTVPGAHGEVWTLLPSDTLSRRILVVFATVVCVWFAWRKLFGKRMRYPPGPRGWPLLGALPYLGTRPHDSLRELSKKYGPIMFMYWGLRPALIVSTPETAKAILKTHDHTFAGRPALENVSYMFWDLQDFAFTGYTHRWRELRKMCTMHLFTHARVVQYQDIRRKEVTAMIQSILDDSLEGKEVRVSRYMANMSTNNVTQMMWNKRHCGLKPGTSSSAQEDALSFHELVREVLDLISAINLGDYIPALRLVSAKLQGYTKRMKAVRNRISDFLDKIIAEHRQLELSAGSTKNDSLLGLMLRSSQEEGSDLKELLTMDTIKAVLMDMIVGATDTTSNTMEWTLAELMKNPDTMKTLQDEINSVVGPDRLVTEADIPNLKYLQAVVQEGLRLHAPGPLGGMHESTEDTVVDGYDIPKGTLCFVNWSCIFFDPKLYKNPHQFDPERFLEESAVDERSRAFEFLPFSAGRRMCPAQILSQTLMQITLANLVHVIDWSLPSGKTPNNLDMTDKYEFVLHMNTPLVLMAKPRLAHHIIYEETFA